jgi:aminopeptidase
VAASAGEDFVRGLLATDDGAMRVGEFGIGLNAALRTPTGDLLIDEKILGTVHIALGRSYQECGGRNRSALHWDIVKDLRDGGTVRVGDRALIADGIVSDELRRYAVAAPDESR